MRYRGFSVRTAQLPTDRARQVHTFPGFLATTQSATRHKTMRTKVLLLLNSALLGLGLLSAFGASIRGDAARDAAPQYGPKLAQALDLVFNDPVLTNKG
jgi:hypothetical protein